MATENRTLAVEMTGITKNFAKVKALDSVDLQLEKGKIHALLGENGAGKSTLMKILYGLYGMDTGEIKINGQLEHIKNPSDAIKLGIGMVHQHFMLVQNFTIAENIILGSEVTKSFGRLDHAKFNADIKALGEKYGLEVDPNAVIQDVSVATQQRVEILKALYRGVDILILDEPTAVLTPQEITNLIETMHQLAADGKTIVIITHKLKEIKAAADACTVIRRGQKIGTVKVCEVSEHDLATMMVGREVKLTTEKKDATPGEVLLELKDLVVRDARQVAKVDGLSLKVREGEIVAIAGVDGNGQTELIDALVGLMPTESGSAFMAGQELTKATPAQVQKSGIKTIHEDRQKRGLVLDFSVSENLIIETYKSKEYGRSGLIRWGKVKNHANKMIDQYDIRPQTCAPSAARDLSGGNQQKVIIAREVNQDPKLLIACQPTRGLDVGAIEYVRKVLVQQRDEGKAVLLVSLELDEVLDLADKIAVIYNGKIVAELDPKKTNEAEIGLYMAGGTAS